MMQALTHDQMMRQAPSIYAMEAHASRSDRFRVIPTASVLKALEREGFEPFKVVQCNTRDASRREFTKHMVRLRKVGDAAFAAGSTSEIVLKNANDGSSSYELMAGIYRLVCSNGMIVGDTYDSVRVKHQGDVVRGVIEGSYKVLETAHRALEVAADWKQIRMSNEAQMALAEAAHILRFDIDSDTPIEPKQLLLPRRRDDLEPDLWTTFNRVQENCLRGGLSARAPMTIDERGRRIRGRMVTTREVRGIDQDVRLNKALWTLAESMAKILH